MAVIAISNEKALVLQVYESPCGRLRPTDERVLVPKQCLPEEYATCAAQCSTCRGIFWILKDGRRWRNMCYCSFCKILFNGSGGNLRSHSTSHSPTQYTQQQKDTALIMFLVRHYVGLTCLRDPITDIFYPGLTFSRAMSLIEFCTNQVKESVIEELDDQSVCLMIDGWTDQSLRRFLGIVVSYFQQDRNRTVYRALALHWGEGRDHRAATQIEAIKSTLTE